MKKAIFLNMASMSPVLEMHLCHIQESSKEHDLTIYYCDSSFKSCTANPFNRKSICDLCQHRALSNIKNARTKIKKISFDCIDNTQQEETVYTHLNLGVMSSLSSITRAIEEEEITGEWVKTKELMLESSILLFRFFSQEIKSHGYEEIMTFNGRFSESRAVVEACRKNNISYMVYDLKKGRHHLSFKNQSLHSIDANTKKAVSFYEENPYKAKRLAEKFFQKKRLGKEILDKVYTLDQKKDLVNYEIKKQVQLGKKLITVYPSSDDEYRYIGEEWLTVDQAIETTSMIKNLDPQHYHIAVRMHPNQRSIPESSKNKYRRMNNFDHCTLIYPEDKDDSYALLDLSEVCISFCSMMGVEASYFGKPVILIGSSNYSKLGVGHTVTDGVEAAREIRNGPQPLNQRGAVTWAYYLMDYQDRLEGFKLLSPGDYRVHGRKIKSSKIKRLAQVPAKFEIEYRKPGFSINKDFMKRVTSWAVNFLAGKWST